MKAVIFHGVRASRESPRAGRADHELWCVTRANAGAAGDRCWNGALTDWTRWFDLHSIEAQGRWPGLKASRAETLAWYAQEPAGGRPIYMVERHPEVPASVRYPIELVQDKFTFTTSRSVSGARGTEESCRFFGCMIDYLFALAILEGFDQIVLNGVGMSHDAGHAFLHRTILYWIGYARGCGVDVIVEGDSCYANANQRLYGYERFGYEELEAITEFMRWDRIDPTDDAAPFLALAQDWEVRARSNPLAYAHELKHLIAALQRRDRIGGE